MTEFNMMPQVIPTIISGPNGTTCVDPAIFGQLAYFDDAVKLAVICFIAGMALVAIFNYIRARWE